MSGGSRLALALLIWLPLISFPGSSQTAGDQLLLVCGESSAIEPLSHADVRKLFLGIPIILNGVRLTPVLNASDPHMTEVFLQKIIFMSRREYERQLVSRVFRAGGRRPLSYENFGELVKELQATPGTLTFMWSAQFNQHKGLKSLGVLWTVSSE